MIKLDSLKTPMIPNRAITNDSSRCDGEENFISLLGIKYVGFVQYIAVGGKLKNKTAYFK